MTRTTGILFGMLFTLLASAQGDHLLRVRADALFLEKNYIEALPLYSQLVSLSPSDRVLNYRFGACMLHGGSDRDKAIGHLKFAVQDPSIPADAWYWLGRAYHLSYLFKDAQVAYQRFQGTATKKELEGLSVAALDKQCQNGQRLLSNLKEITVRNKLEADDTEFFRFYDLSDIGGKIVVLPDELKSPLDRKSKERTLIYLPDKGGPIYFGSYGKDGKTGRDIYRTELLPDGKFASPIKLAGYINTDQDEDFAFPHPDGKSFYFSSKGHNSMGGYDVFRSAYDKGLDTFGPPVNLDFAVNTPDDDLFYIVDPQNVEACFASGRDSKQGKLHVYRVSTAQVPLVLTVLKGTFANAFEPTDRKARIVVEDAVTRERITEVRTDINGSYVLALPRSGQFRFSVDCGPSGKTHTGTVDIPRSSSPRAFRQELELTRNGDLEKLVIRNYFDSPLEEDMIALMMEEIKRRARLDVTAQPVIAQHVEPAAPKGNVMDQAGFAGDMTEAKAVEMARNSAADLDRNAFDLDVQSKAAFGLAVEAVTEAERTAKEAGELVNQADRESDETSKNALMVQAAELRQRSRAANLRARSALHTGQDLDAEGMVKEKQAARAGKLALDLDAAVRSDREAEKLKQLTALKADIDERSRPDADPGIAERSRRAVIEQEKEAGRSLNAAIASRAEENDLIDRITRKKRERDEARSKSSKEELSTEIAEYERQLAHLHDEVDAAFAKSRDQERQAAMLRGKASLTQYLNTTGVERPGTDLNADQVAGLGQRIAGNETRVADLTIDDRFEAQLASDRSEVGARTFDWSLAASAIGTSGSDRAGTITAQKTTATDRSTAPSQSGNTTTSAKNGGAVPGTSVIKDGVGIVPVESRTGNELAIADNAVGGTEGNVPLGNDAGTSPIKTSDKTSDTVVAASTVENTDRTSSEVVSRKRVGDDDGTAAIQPRRSASELEMQGFILENQRAEIVQAIKAEKNKARTDSLQTQLGQLDARIAQNSGEQQALRVADRAATDEISLAGVDMSRVAATFYPDSKDEEIVSLVYLNYEQDKQRIEAMPDPTVRAQGLSGLELMLADSLRGELVRQAAILELAPQQGDRVLPKLERLRQMRQEHIQRSDKILRDHGSTMAMADTHTTELPRERSTTSASITYPLGQDPIADRFVSLTPATTEIFASKLEHRAPRLEEALARKEADLARMDMIDQQVDSIEAGMNGLPKKEYEKQRKAADRLIDERMILRVDLGQRSSFLAREEWRTINDSVKTIDKRLTTLGLAQDENLLLMARTMQADAKSRFTQAELLRKNADRSEDIVERDSLYRSAYATELSALREMDRSLTVKNYLLGSEFKRGETLAYEVVAGRVLGLDNVLLAKAEQPVAKKATATGVPGSATNEPNGTNAGQNSTADGLSPNGTGTTEPIAVQRSTASSQDAGTNAGQNAAADGLSPNGTGTTEPVAVQRSTASSQNAGTNAGQNSTDSELSPNGTGTTEPVAVQLSTASSQGAGTNAGQNAADGELSPNGTGTTEPGAVQGSTASSRDAGTNDPIQRTAIPEGTEAVLSANTSPRTADTERAKGEALEIARKAEASMPAIARSALERYENYLKSENVILREEALDPALDPQYLALQAERAGRGSAELEQRSLEVADEATALEDEAVGARKRDRERLTVLAVRKRTESDSLHSASLLMAEDARSLELQKRDAEQALALRNRLVKYYYLTSEEQGMVVKNADQSRYFQAKARALEQYDMATEAEDASRINRELGSTLKEQAALAQAEVAAGRMTREEAAVRREILVTRGDLLVARADSLKNVAARLRGAAGINEGQATVMLQALPETRSNEWMALEMRTRRTEALLAETRDQAGRQAQVPLASGANVGSNVSNNIADQGRVDDPSADDLALQKSAGVTNTGTAKPTGTSTTPPVERTTRAITPPFGTDSGSPEARKERVIENIAPSDPSILRYPEELVSDIFQLRAPGVRSATPIPMDMRLPQGVVFKVQIGAFRKPIPEEAFSDMTPVMGEHTDNGLVRYTAGLFTGFEQADAAKELVRDRGYRDAFVVAYLDGKRISLGVAMRELAGGALADGATPAGNASTEQGGSVTQPIVREPGNATVQPRITTPPAAAPAVIQSPVIIPTTVQPTPSKDPLANYPASAEEIVSKFVETADAASYYNVPGAAPARQVETVRGLFFTVQVGVYSKPVPLDKIFNIAPLNTERTETAKIRYTTGVFADAELARVRKDETVVLGVKDAFVTAYLNGKRIPMQEAAALLQKFGTGILAKP